MKLRALVIATLVVVASSSARAVEIPYRSFSGSATMGPEAEAFAAKAASLTTTALGVANVVHFAALPGLPAIPSQFGGSVLAAVGAGAARGGFDAAYISGTDLDAAWGFIYNSGVPFGPRFEEFLGFLYGRSVGGTQTGLALLQSLLDARGRNVVALPVVASSEQLSGYFLQPIGDNDGHERGIGLSGLCQQPWTLRYLPPAQWVLDKACDTLVAERRIHHKNLRFIAAVPGNGSLVEAVRSGQLQGFEFATPLDDVSQLFVGADNPGTVGVRYVHAPGWHQQFLITWMIVNKDVWSALSPAQQALVESVARDRVLSSYGESMQRQGEALRYILSANRRDRSCDNDIVLSQWPERDLDRLSEATNQVLNARASDPSLSTEQRHDYATVLDALRRYVRANYRYWSVRSVRRELRLDRWRTPTGHHWTDDDDDDDDGHDRR
jgi:TRAP-type mannitol/chloroaromatic compound transport system substrate-binding protein